jgi:hypothetical protein
MQLPEVEVRPAEADGEAQDDYGGGAGCEGNSSAFSSH